MTNVFKRLAARLDEFPQGFPPSGSGVELKILEKIFSAEEAKFALNLNPLAETAEEIAIRLEKPFEEVQTVLDRMARKGQINCSWKSGRHVYSLVPFIVGIYEFQLNRLDEELASLLEEYKPALIPTIGGHEPALGRVIPVNASIKAELQILRYEDVRKIIVEAKSIRVSECICRKKESLIGNDCKHTWETCLAFSSEPDAFDHFAISGKVISKEDAIRILELSEQEGLTHVTYNVQQNHNFICNCCPCCCEFLKGLKEYKAPYLLACSNFVALIDQETCIACGVCAEDRCPIEAISEHDEKYIVKEERCIGCGVCTITCPSDSITMEKKAESRLDKPPINFKRWMVKRKINRKKAESSQIERA